MATVHECFHQKHIVTQGRFDDGHSFRVVESKRLLTQNMLPSIGGFDSPLRVQGMRSRDIDRLDLVVCKESFVASIAAWHLPDFSKGIGSLLRTTAYSQ